MNDDQVSRIAVAVWGQLWQRGWFAKHVDDNEIESLDADLTAAIARALDE